MAEFIIELLKKFGGKKMNEIFLKYRFRVFL